MQQMVADGSLTSPLDGTTEWRRRRGRRRWRRGRRRSQITLLVNAAEHAVEDVTLGRKLCNSSTLDFWWKCQSGIALVECGCLACYATSPFVIVCQTRPKYLVFLFCFTEIINISWIYKYIYRYRYVYSAVDDGFIRLQNKFWQTSDCVKKGLVHKHIPVFATLHKPVVSKVHLEACAWCFYFPFNLT